MKRLFIFLAIIFIAAPAICADLQWDASIGAESYEVRYRAIGAPSWIALAPIATTTFDLDTLPLTADTRYEFQVYAMAQGSYSGGSDIIRWTFEGTPAVVEIFESPKSLVFHP